ncbi:cardiolipin synthase ClsB [Rhodocyclus gracilis]|uniref:Cardiolipin synthase B n=1 Tax=Rhodocyclus tenuis TaxID=1066 RepID=A0A6L5JZX6_RHOTE|nr:cardiolipin synthase ClsB [Rhodocyclus gracilis]MQY52214.1 cardiolipin synthase ClsB [Rhodocyclus gracilis]
MHLNFAGGNRLTLLTCGGEYFPALRAAIDAASQDVHLESYLFADDATGREIAAALARAARRGIRVRLLVDGFGARDSLPALTEHISTAGGAVLAYRPEIARFSLNRQRLRRMHRKLALIDGHIAFIGGINVIDDLDTPHQTAPRFDFAVRVEGPLLADIDDALWRLWRAVSWTSLRQHAPRPQKLTALPCGGQRAALVVRDNLRHRRAIENAYLDAIAAARDDILIANAYFLPTPRFLRALRAAAARGVRVSLLLQGHVEFCLLHYATQSLYDDLLASGVRIHLYQRGFLHAKVAVIDTDWATVGSSNIDPFSLLAAREANLVVHDPAFASELRAQLSRAMREDAGELPAAHWRKRRWLARQWRHLAYALISLAVGLSGFGRRPARRSRAPRA